MRSWPAAAGPLERQLSEALRAELGHGRGVRDLMRTELALRLLEHLGLEEDVLALPAVISGYALDGQRTAAEPLIGNARQLTAYFKGSFGWRNALRAYRTLPDAVRLFAVDEAILSFRRRAPAIAPRRDQVYDDALEGELPFGTRAGLAPAPAGGTYQALDSTVVIPADLGDPGPLPTHDLSGSASRRPIEVDWASLCAVARAMDAADPTGAWAERLGRVRLRTHREASSGFAETETLVIDGRLHMAGMVSSGKSTLMHVLSVWAAQQGLRVTLVVSTVIEALDRAEHLSRFGIRAVPVLGSNRAQHVERMHKFSARRTPRAPLEQVDPVFRFLSTACPLDALRITGPRFEVGKTPCRDLREPGSGRTYACPLYVRCPLHAAAREMPAAEVWVTTPQALVSSGLPRELNTEMVRLSEVVYRRSDLVVFDEADRVQVHLDAALAPGDALAGERNALSDQLDPWAAARLAEGLRRQYPDPSVSTWLQTLRTFEAAQEAVYALLERNEQVRRLVEGDCFSEWTLYRRLVYRWRRPAWLEDVETPEVEDADFGALEAAFEAYHENPLGTRQGVPVHELAGLTMKVLLDADGPTTRTALADWLSQQPVAVDPSGLEREADLLSMALATTALAYQLDVLLQMWPRVAEVTDAEEERWRSFERPARDYLAVVPEAPMGNLLGFRYDRSEFGRRSLRYYRFGGVGRWLMLNMHRLFPGDRVRGPNVLLMSGTSWAGDSPAFHVQAPVDAILLAPDAEVRAIERTRFEFRPLYDQGTAIHLSGAPMAERGHRLRAMARELVARDSFGSPGILAKLLTEGSLLESRRRALVVVGSYPDAKTVADQLRRLDWEGRDSVVHLVSDDEGEAGLVEPTGASIPRGDVERFVALGAQVLVAPLLAIERGFNIVNEDGSAAIGAAFFLTRPLPRPDDLDFAIQSLNRWAIDHLQSVGGDPKVPLSATWRDFQGTARGLWRRLGSLDMRYGSMAGRDRDAVTWNALVMIWQVVGRLVRGGSPAQVFFCDASFAPEATGGARRPGLLAEMDRVLASAIDGEGAADARASAVAAVLYSPLHKALSEVTGALV